MSGVVPEEITGEDELVRQLDETNSGSGSTNDGR